MAESRLVQLNFENSDYTESSIVFIYSVCYDLVTYVYTLQLPCSGIMNNIHKYND